MSRAARKFGVISLMTIRVTSLLLVALLLVFGVVSFFRLCHVSIDHYTDAITVNERGERMTRRRALGAMMKDGLISIGVVEQRNFVEPGVKIVWNTTHPGWNLRGEIFKTDS